MCDYSLMNVASRPAKVGEKLITHRFSGGTLGFASPQGKEPVAICLLPGTEVAFDEPFMKNQAMGWFMPPRRHSKTAIFRQIRKDEPHVHHDALETPDGEVILLNGLAEHQTATVLQLPAEPKTEAEAKEQERLKITA